MTERAQADQQLVEALQQGQEGAVKPVGIFEQPYFISLFLNSPHPT